MLLNIMTLLGLFKEVTIKAQNIRLYITLLIKTTSHGIYLLAFFSITCC